MRAPLLLTTLAALSCADASPIVHVGAELTAPNRIDFGEVVIGTQATTTIELRNTGELGVRITAIEIGPGFDGVFAAHASSAALAPSASVLITVTFSPTVPSAPESWFRIVTDATTDAAADATTNPSNRTNPNTNTPRAVPLTHTVEVHGLGVRPEGERAEALSCQPPAINFGVTEPGAPTARTITCTNAGDAPSTVTGIRLGAGASAAFAVDASPTPFTVAPFGHFELEVRFEVTDADHGARTDVLELDTSGRPIRVALGGYAGQPTLSVVPGALAFGRVGVGFDRIARVALTNVGARTLHIHAVTSSSARFTPRVRTTTVEPGDVSVVDVVYRPTAADFERSELIIDSDDLGDPQVRIPMTGEGVVVGPCLWQVTPDPVSFGVLSVGSGADRTVRIENVGRDDCLLSDVALARMPADFQLVRGGLDESIGVAPGGARPVVLRFTPQTVGDQRAALLFQVTDPTSPINAVQITGTGAPAGCTPAAGALGTPRFPAPSGLPYSNPGDNVAGWTPLPGQQLWTTDGAELIGVGYHDALPVSANSFTLDADVVIEDGYSDLQFTLWDETFLVGYKISLGPANGDTPYFGIYKVINDPARNVAGRPFGDDRAIFCHRFAACNPPYEPEAGDLRSVDTGRGGYPRARAPFHFHLVKRGPTVTMHVNGLPPLTYSAPCLDNDWRLVLGSWANVRVKNLVIR